ncbi:MAG: F0F1 ATP synthase subunit A [Dysgonamonadaceae bacterium]
MKSKINIYYLLIICLLFVSTSLRSAEQSSSENASKEGDVKELILGHIADSYEWHVFSSGDIHVTIPLPIILYSKSKGWNIFMSNKFHQNDGSYNGYYISDKGIHKDKIIERDALGNESRPLDLSLTKNAASLLMASILLIIIVMIVARSYRQDPINPKKGFIGMMEILIVSINNDIIKPTIGEGSDKYAPYLLTLFFFIFINNLLGLIPIFPGGANVTGNIAITLVLALTTFFVVTFSGTKEYFKDIFWPDVPTWLKVPIPLMPAIELVSVITKPFTLMIRLFANIMAGHSIVLGLTCVIFVTVSLGTAINATMTGVAVVFVVFMDFVELLVAYIQAYVFTILTALYIGMARIKPHHTKHIEESVIED